MSRPRDARSEAMTTESFPLRKARRTRRPLEDAKDLVSVPVIGPHAGSSRARRRERRVAFSLLLVNTRIFEKDLESSAESMSGCTVEMLSPASLSDSPPESEEAEPVPEESVAEESSDTRLSVAVSGLPP